MNAPPSPTGPIEPRFDPERGAPTLDPAVLEAARSLAAAEQRPLVVVLAEQLDLPRADALVLLGNLLQAPVWRLADLQATAPDFSAVRFADALARQCLVVIRDEQPWVAIGDPMQDGLLDWLDARLAQPFRVALVDPDEVAAQLAVIEHSQRAIDSVMTGTQDGGARGAEVEVISLATIAEEIGPAVKLLNSTLYDALKSEASDIHLESHANGLTIKYRIDGVLTSVGQIGGVELSEQVVSRLKVMSELDITEHRVPQDGRFKARVLGREVDFRVSIMPSLFGEDAVLRILDKQALTQQMQSLTLETLGFDDLTRALIRKLAHEPYGMLLVTGPTGSGKTTTLYAALGEINNGEDKIITVEDPVEYQLAGVLQIPVNEKKGLTFARGLRSILRHDPDKIMVGEIRDPETAQIAVQAALTGHLVLTTVHANNVFDVIGRFLHMEVEAYSLVSALNGVLAQRLVRRICPQCRTPEEPPPELLAASGLTTWSTSGWKFHVGRGCAHCRGSGYRGRLAVAEVLPMTDTLRELILARAPMSQVKEAARRAGTRLLREVALAAVARGDTTLVEVNRVTFVE